MCDPLTIAGVALSGVSAAANASAASKASRARDDALAAERIRQNSLDKEAAALNVQSQDRYQDFEGQQEKRGGELTDFFQGQRAEAGTSEAPAAMPQSGSNITVREEAKQRENAQAYTDRTGAALGDLRSFGDLMGSISRLQGRDASMIGQLGGFKRGSSGILPLELDAASQKGSGMKMLGDLAGGFGGLALNAGLSGASLPGLGGAAAPAANVATSAARVPVLTPRPNLASLYGGSTYSLYGGGR